MRKRKRSGVINLPTGVHRVVSKGQAYYYFAPGRGTKAAGERVPLGIDPTAPKFWAKLNGARGMTPEAVKPGTFAALIRDFKTSAEWTRLRPNTRRDYLIYLDRVERAWGALVVSGLTAVGIYALRDRYAATPVAANHLAAILRSLMAWGIKRGYHDRNPAIDVTPIEISDIKGARPWPEAAYQLVLDRAPEVLRRAAILGRACGQRRSDLVRFGRKNRRDDGIEITIGKLRDLRHFIPLRKSELSEIDSWSCSDTGPWIVSARGEPMNGSALGELLDQFVERTPELAEAGPIKLHGLRAMAVCDRRLDGLEHQEISAQLGMSLAMVMRYSKQVDQEALARRGNAKRERGVNQIVKLKGDEL
jgi:hypothetical protein